MPEGFRHALAPFHQFRQNALIDATIALTQEASLTLSSIGRYLPGSAQVKDGILSGVSRDYQLRLVKKGELWLRREALLASSKPDYLGPGTLAHILKRTALDAVLNHLAKTYRKMNNRLLVL